MITLPQDVHIVVWRPPERVRRIAEGLGDVDDTIAEENGDAPSAPRRVVAQGDNLADERRIDFTFLMRR